MRCARCRKWLYVFVSFLFFCRLKARVWKLFCFTGRWRLEMLALESMLSMLLPQSQSCDSEAIWRKSPGAKAVISLRQREMEGEMYAWDSVLSTLQLKGSPSFTVFISRRLILAIHGVVPQRNSLEIKVLTCLTCFFSVYPNASKMLLLRVFASLTYFRRCDGDGV